VRHVSASNKKGQADGKVTGDPEAENALLTRSTGDESGGGAGRREERGRRGVFVRKGAETETAWVVFAPAFAEKRRWDKGGGRR